MMTKASTIAGFSILGPKKGDEPVKKGPSKKLGESNTKNKDFKSEGENKKLFRAILERREKLLIQFQPILDITDNRIVGFEAISYGPKGTKRSKKPALHFPNALFSYAERQGKLIELETICCRSILRDFSPFPGYLKLFLNVSPRSLPKPEIMSILLEGAKQYRNRLVVEITERDKIKDFDLLKQAVLSLRDKGIEIAVDDVSDGYSRLSVIAELDPDYIKIDHEYIHRLVAKVNSGEPNRYREVSGSIVHLSKGVKAKVVAEGIEHPSQLRVLKSLGIDIDLAQGHLWGRPAPAHHWIGEYLDEHRQRSTAGGGLL
ncbi:MAG: EAL domain-containing protein [Peptococcaceae bacterium]|nr:EAL domain-containing protein [Peptococcaceae bacterium]